MNGNTAFAFTREQRVREMRPHKLILVRNSGEQRRYVVLCKQERYVAVTDPISLWALEKMLPLWLRI